MMTDCLLVMTTLPDQDTARSLARKLLEARLAACINILPAMLSLYVWQGQTCEAQEYLLLIKTQQSRYPQLATWLRAQHPYELPEIIALPLQDGLPEYLGWIIKSTQE